MSIGSIIVNGVTWLVTLLPFWFYAFLIGVLLTLLLTNLLPRVLRYPSPNPKRRRVVDDEPIPLIIDSSNVYRCGWLYITREFINRLDFDLRLLQSITPAVVPINVFFAVLQGGQLKLYTDESQQTLVESFDGLTEPGKYMAELFPPGMYLDELYKKEYPIKLIVRRDPETESSSGGGAVSDKGELESVHESIPNLDAQSSAKSTPLPFKDSVYFFYAPNASEKEDWLIALRVATGALEEIDNRPLVSYLDSIHDTMHGLHDGTGAAISALVARLMPHLTCSTMLRRMIETRFARREKTIRKPPVVGDVKIKDLRFGTGFPVLTNGRLHHCTRNGELLVSLDLVYTGGFFIHIATSVCMDMPAFISNLAVPVELTLNIQRLAGRILVKIKPPPSDRLWYAFEKTPEIEMKVTPVLSSTTVTWPLVIALIERGVRESLQEFVVLPNFDDAPIPPPIDGIEYLGILPYLGKKNPPIALFEHVQEQLALETKAVAVEAASKTGLYRAVKSTTDLPMTQADRATLLDESLDEKHGSSRMNPLDSIPNIIKKPTVFLASATGKFLLGGDERRPESYNPTLDKLQSIQTGAQERLIQLQASSTRAYRGIKHTGGKLLHAVAHPIKTLTGKKKKNGSEEEEGKSEGNTKLDKKKMIQSGHVLAQVNYEKSKLIEGNRKDTKGGVDLE